LKKARALLLLTIAAPLTARTGAAPARPAVDQDYVAALATANRFRQAWHSQDQEAGLLLGSDKVRGHTAEEHLQSLFSPAANAAEAREISGGKKLKAGRLHFLGRTLQLPQRYVDAAAFFEDDCHSRGKGHLGG
jgi:hypothetical protein